MNREVTKYKDSEEAYDIVKKQVSNSLYIKEQIEHYDDLNTSLMKKVGSIQKNYKGERKFTNDLITQADKGISFQFNFIITKRKGYGY